MADHFRPRPNHRRSVLLGLTGAVVVVTVAAGIYGFVAGSPNPSSRTATAEPPTAAVTPSTVTPTSVAPTGVAPTAVPAGTGPATILVPPPPTTVPPTTATTVPATSTVPPTTATSVAPGRVMSIPHGVFVVDGKNVTMTTVVVPGENLTEIAAWFKLMGGEPALDAMNRSAIGLDPDLIHPGLVLHFTVALKDIPTISPIFLELAQLDK